MSDKDGATETSHQAGNELALDAQRTDSQGAVVELQNPLGKVELDDFGLPVKKKTPTAVATAVPKALPSIPSGAQETDDAEISVPKDEKKEDELPTKSEGTERDLKGPGGHVPTSSISSAHRNVAPAGLMLKDSQTRDRSDSKSSVKKASDSKHKHQPSGGAPSEWSHQMLAPQAEQEDAPQEEETWQEMPAYAPFDIYNDDNKLVAREFEDESEELAYGSLGGAGKGYTRVQMDEDAQSATSMDDNTAYLFKEHGTNVQDEDDDVQDASMQLQTTKGLLTETQKIAYAGLTRLAMIEMTQVAESLERTRSTKKAIDACIESYKLWSQKIMVRIYAHMEIESAEQLMIEQLTEHGIIAADLAPALKQNARVDNPVRSSISSGQPFRSPKLHDPYSSSAMLSPNLDHAEPRSPTPLPAYEEIEGDSLSDVKTPMELPNTQTIDIDLRWTVLCDLFLLLIADSVYDSRSRKLLEVVGGFLDVTPLDICRFEKRVSDALEVQEAASKENWNEDEHMENRRKLAKSRRLMLMGLATVGGGLVIGLSAGLLAPVIGAGLAAGFTTIGVAGTGGFLAGAGGAAIITTTGLVTGGTIAVRATGRRTGAVQVFEYRPLHNNKRVNLIVSVPGWMTGKVDDVRLPFSTVDPVMGDIYSVFWEPEMLQSMGDTINILATEALTQGLQQILGSTILIALMAAIQLPIVLTKLSYLIDNPWSVSVARSDAAALILADSLMAKNLGSRPVTLVGFSLGSRVIFGCLRELAAKGAIGIVQNVYTFGTPVIANKEEWTRARTVVAGRFVNGYATNDWILGYLFRATGGGIKRVAGLAPVEVPGVENIDVSELVPGHMSYRSSMPKLLRKVGWAVTSDEFFEIEDPDPENHKKRQRELIDEIEEARKKLEEKPEKKKWAFFGRKKAPEKKNWETYDDKSQQADRTGKADEIGAAGASGVLFDLDALREEIAALSVAALSEQGIQIKQLETTLPPMKLDLNKSELPPLRHSMSLNEAPNTSPATNRSLSLPAESSWETEAASANGARRQNSIDSLGFAKTSHLEPEPPAYSSRANSVASAVPSGNSLYNSPESEHLERPSISHTMSMPNVLSSPDFMQNAWTDEETLGNEGGEMKMTFE